MILLLSAGLAAAFSAPSAIADISRASRQDISTHAFLSTAREPFTADHFLDARHHFSALTAPRPTGSFYHACYPADAHNAIVRFARAAASAITNILIYHRNLPAPLSRVTRAAVAISVESLIALLKCQRFSTDVISARITS